MQHTDHVANHLTCDPSLRQAVMAWTIFVLLACASACIIVLRGERGDLVLPSVVLATTLFGMPHHLVLAFSRAGCFVFELLKHLTLHGSRQVAPQIANWGLCYQCTATGRTRQSQLSSCRAW